MSDVEVWVVIDQDGNYAVGANEDQAREHYEEDIGAIGDATAFQAYQLNLSVPTPAAIVVSGALKQAGPHTLTIS